MPSPPEEEKEKAEHGEEYPKKDKDDLSSLTHADKDYRDFDWFGNKGGRFVWYCSVPEW